MYHKFRVLQIYVVQNLVSVHRYLFISKLWNINGMGRFVSQSQSCYDSLFFTQFKTMLPWLRIESDFKLGIIYRLANEQKLISSTIQFNMS